MTNKCGTCIFQYPVIMGKGDFSMYICTRKDSQEVDNKRVSFQLAPDSQDACESFEDAWPL